MLELNWIVDHRAKKCLRSVYACVVVGNSFISGCPNCLSEVFNMSNKGQTREKKKKKHSRKDPDFPYFVVVVQLLIHVPVWFFATPWTTAPQASLSLLSPSSWVLSHFSHVQLLMTPWIVALRRLCPWDSLGKNTGVCCHTLLQGIFMTHGSNPRFLCLLHW